MRNLRIKSMHPNVMNDLEKIYRTYMPQFFASYHIVPTSTIVMDIDYFIGWYKLLKLVELSEEFLLTFSAFIDKRDISRYQRLSHKFILENADILTRDIFDNDKVEITEELYDKLPDRLKL